MEWKNALAKAICLPPNALSSMSNGDVVATLFHDCIYPGIEIGSDGNTVDIPDDFNIKIHGCHKLYKLLIDKDLFNNLPLFIQKSTLDILCFTLRRSVHDVARFRYFEKTNKIGIVDILLQHLTGVLHIDKNDLTRDDVLIAKRVIRLIGVVAVGGMTTPELKQFLSLLRLPSLFSISLLQALKSILMVNDAIVKAYPLSFFDFCGSKDGISIAPFTFPFTKEYQVSFWFRVERYSKTETGHKQHLFSYMNNINGLAVYLEDDVLCVSVSNGPGETTVIKCSTHQISQGVWYNFCVTHNKPRMTLFAKFEMTITLDGKTCFQDIVRFPSASTIDNMTNASIGKNFDGQIGPVYVFDEVIPLSSIELIGRRDAGKPLKEALKKSVTSKVLSVYHPQRYDGRQVVEYHGEHHGVLSDDAYVCNLIPVRETLTSLGGVACLLPLFPALTVENEELRADILSQVAASPMPCGWEATGASEIRRKPRSSYVPANVGLGTSLYDIMTDEELPHIFGVKTIVKLDISDIFELQDDKPIGLLIFTLARCMRQHYTHQRALMDVGGVQMISYCLSRISAESRIMKEEDESCILALLQLRDAVVNSPELEVLVMRELICNMNIWSTASFKLQKSLYSVILANIKAQTDFFEDVFGVQSIIDHMHEFYLHVVDKTVLESNNLVYVSSSPSDIGGGIVHKVEEDSPPAHPAAAAAAAAAAASTAVALDMPLTPGRIKQKSKSMYVISTPPTGQIPSDISSRDQLEETRMDVSTSGGTTDSCDNDTGGGGGPPTDDEGDVTSSTSPITTGTTRRGSGTKEFLKSVSRRMSTTDVSARFDNMQQQEKHTSTSRPARFSDFKDQFSRTMSIKFVSPLESPGIRRSFSFGGVTMPVGDGEDEGDNELAMDEGGGEDDHRDRAVTRLSSEQRKTIRSILQSMIIVLSMHRCGINEVEPLFFFLQDCEDNTVLDEIVQLLLCIVVGDSSFRIVTTMMELFKGPEDFLAFILNRLEHRPCEPLRCSCFALLIHFYLRIDNLSSSLVNSSASKIKKGSKLFKNREKYSSLGEGNALQRLDGSGGLASLCVLLNSHRKECGVDTYKTLFSLLFVNRSSTQHITPYFKKMFKECVGTAPARTGDFHLDESQEILNPAMLVSYFYFAPKLPMSVQENVHCDLLAMLKHNPENRELFRENVSWHLCMYDLVGQLVVIKEGGSSMLLRSTEVMSFLKAWALFQRPHKEGSIRKLFISKSTHNLEIQPHKEKDKDKGKDKGRVSVKKHASLPPTSEDKMLEMWFDIGMKTYATMLVHSMDKSGGFIEIQRTSSQSFDSVQGAAVTLSIFSHLLHELTFTIQSKYKDMQRMARSTNSDEVDEATVILENMLSIIILLSLYLYEKDTISLMGVPDVALARRRWSILTELRKSQQGKPGCTSSCTAETHGDVCGMALDKCNLCGHSLALHVTDEKSIMDMVEEILLAETSSSDTEEKTDVEGDSDTPVDTSTPATTTPTTPPPAVPPVTTTTSGAADSVATHAWMDLRSGVGYPPDINAFPKRQSSKSKNLFIGETLNPLERGFATARGKMVVSLQVLRYFDTIFWPEENRLRNNHLLNFDIPAAKGSQRKTTKGVATAPPPPPMTMYSAVMRASLFVFHSLSPFTEIAELNVRRLEQLFKIIEQVPNTCPTNDWTMVILAHLILSLQRIYSSIGDAYDMLGIDTPVTSPDPTSNLDIPNDVFGDHAATEQLNNMFNHPAGKQLVQYVNSCITLLVVIYSTRKDFLSSRLDDKAFLSLTLLVQNTQNYHFHVPSVKENYSFVSRKRSGSFREPTRKFSDDLSDEVGKSSPKGSPRLSPFSSKSGSNFSFAKSRSNASSHFSTDETDHECDEKVCEDALYALCFLRDPFFQLDVMKSESMLDAFFSLENFEFECTRTYLKEMVKLQDELMLKRNMIGNMIDEIDELTELGMEGKRAIIAKNLTRKTNKSVRHEISTKTFATFWNNCLRMFEESWSPWSSEREGDDHEIGNYTASVHRDASMRRMVMIRNDEQVDYSEAAYFEGKLRDQQDYYEGLSSKGLEEREELEDTKGSPGANSSFSFMKDTLLLTRPKASKLSTIKDSATRDNNSDGDSDSTEDAEETTVDVKRNENIFSSVLSTSVEKRPLWALTFAWHSDEHEIFSAEVMEIMTEQVLSGTVLLTNRNIYFHPKKRAGGFLVKPDEFRNKRWQLGKMTECYGRRYLLQNCGIELFFSDSPELFFAFNTHKESHRFFRFLKKLSLPSLVTPLSLSPSYIFQHSSWTELWKKRAISNFEYIMRLNIIAGRSYNDITQYPVFPWVLSDYTSETIDLKDPSVYRDLSKPIGALNPERLVEILDRYKSFGEMDMPQFMYGSHYSSAGLILHFLLRQEPFTSMAIALQGGRFDCPDRLFFNIKDTWRCCNTSMSDVKELVPQMYYFPEAFVNSNALPLGDLQDDRGAVDAVLLPPWCGGNPFEFVRIHREALESEYVSEHLHEWIDLIFGFKQTGPASVEANNVFHYLTYENAIDIEAITDPLQKAAAKAQVTHFGQTPSQITVKEHPKRNPLEDCIVSFCAFPTSECLDRFQCYLHPKQCGLNGEHGAVVAMNCSSSQLVVFYSDFTVAYHKWSTVPETNKTPFSLKFDKSREIPNCSSSIFYHYIPAKDETPDIEKMSGIRSRATSVGEGLSTLFRRNYFSQGDNKKTTGSVDSKQPQVSANEVEKPPAPLPTEIVANVTQKHVDDETCDNGSETAHSESSSGSTPVRLDGGGESLSRTLFIDSGDPGADDAGSGARPSLGEKYVSERNVRNKHVAIKMGEGSNGFVISCGYWNNAMKVHGLKDSLVEVMCKSGGHEGQITCLTMGSDQHTLVTGGEDGTCRVWHINSAVDLTLERQHVLLGHAHSVTAVAYSSHHDLVLSASKNGYLCVHTAQRGRFVRSITSLCSTNSHPVDQLGISSAGYLITHSSADCCLNAFWINGQHLSKVILESSVGCMTFNKEGTVLFCGLASGEVAVLRTWDLKRICSIDLPEYGRITCLKLVVDDQYLLIGSEKGVFHVGTDPDMRWKVLHSVISMNPLISSTL